MIEESVQLEARGGHVLRLDLERRPEPSATFVDPRPRLPSTELAEVCLDDPEVPGEILPAALETGSRRENRSHSTPSRFIYRGRIGLATSCRSKGTLSSLVRGIGPPTILAPVHVCVRELVFLLPRRIRHSGVVAAACRTWGHERLTLPVVSPDDAFPGFESAAVTVTAMPTHRWTSPLSDLVALTKIAIVIQPRRVLEIGSFQGHAALMLAANTQESTRITAVDILEDHGAVYRGTSFAERITRHAGTVETLDDRGPYDLIFVDADHRRQEVERDTRSAVELSRPGTVVVWHDYCDTHWGNRINRVPEVLAEWEKRLPIAALKGTSLAVCRIPGGLVSP